jgi:ABC-type branched-subunit amino acid transport system ATPase component
MINDDIGVKMKYPTISNLNLFEEINESSTYDILQQSIEYVYDAENIYDEFTEDEMKTFIESMDKTQIEKLSIFFETMPRLEQKIEYTCKGCKKKVEYTLRGLNDFFT